jgi:calcineurin-like phosphoesterase family protein
VANIFITSDPHFGHENILGFTKDDGTSMRSFNTVQQMDDTIIDRWNAVVRPQDKVYVLGDIAMKRQYIATIARANGHKRLVRGNHDIFRTKDYLPFFEEIYASRKLENLFLTHIPIHPESLRYDWINVHGHVHNNVPALHFGKRYINVSTEVTNYTPLAIEQVRELARERFSDEELLALRNEWKFKCNYQP